MATLKPEGHHNGENSQKKPNHHLKKGDDGVDGASQSHILQEVSEASPLTDKSNNDHANQRDLELAAATKLNTNNKQQQLQQNPQQQQSSGELFMSA